MCKGHPGGTGFEGMKELSRAAEAWHCVAGMGFLKKAQERLLVKVQPSCSERPRVQSIIIRAGT